MSNEIYELTQLRISGEEIYFEIENNDGYCSIQNINTSQPYSLKEKLFFFRNFQYTNLSYCVLFYGCIQGYMEQLFPSNYSLFENLLLMDPITIGTAAFLQKLLFTIASPIWGIIIDNYEPIGIIKLSVISLAISTLFVCFSYTIKQFFFGMCCWGLFSAVLGPLSQKIASDKIFDGTRGKYFGKLMFFQSIGRQFALIFTGITLRSRDIKYDRKNFFGYWMFPFFFPSLIGLFLYIYLEIVSSKKNNLIQNQQTSSKSIDISSLINLNYVLKSRIVIYLFVLGMVNAIPRSALNFIPMWLQLTGLSHASTSFIVSVSWVAAMIISPVVGLVSDVFYKLSASKGRILMAQFSLLLRSIFIYYLIVRVPIITSNYNSENSKLITFSIISFIIGLFAGWPGIGAFRPILCEVILPQHRATVFALSSTFEGIGAAFFGTRFVGDLAVSIFGYNFVGPNTGSRSNYVALGNAILCMTIIPWLLSILLFYFVVIETHNKSDEKIESDIHKFSSSNTILEIKIV